MVLEGRLAKQTQRRETGEGASWTFILPATNAHSLSSASGRIPLPFPLRGYEKNQLEGSELTVGLDGIHPALDWMNNSI